MTLRYFGLLLFICCQLTLLSQTDTTSPGTKPSFEMHAGIDLYYGNQLFSSSQNIQYMVSSARNDEVNLNLAYLDLQYKGEGYRGRIVPGFGAYINSNYASESQTLKNLVEASAGIRVSRRRNIWVDAGVIGSPYTYENPFSKDQLLYTRSLAAENAPYYLCGIKGSIPLSSALNLNLFLLNGWQQISDQNNKKAFGSQLEFRRKRHTLSWSLYAGDERSTIEPDFRMRYFTDLYWVYDSSGNFALSSNVYAGLQEMRTLQGTVYREWGQANVTARYHFTKESSLSGRIEYFHDPFSVFMRPQPMGTGLKTSSFTIGYNYQFSENALLRMESRAFLSDRNTFHGAGNTWSDQMLWLIANLCTWF